MPAYSEAVKSGLYAKKTGLTGKYDNVRRYWEDEITRHFLYAPLQKLVDHCQQQMRRIRILDLGCGSADGYELLKGIRLRDADLDDAEVYLLTDANLSLYKGCDLNEDLLGQARAIYGNNPELVFSHADFTQEYNLLHDDLPFDLYFTSYGTCSHHTDDRTLSRLLSDIARVTDDYAIVVCDWLGRYCYEWQSLWTNDPAENRVMDYVVSYIYEEEERERQRDQLQHLNLRLMGRPEVDSIVGQASEDAGVAIRPLLYFDRSVFTGRHMDTGEYNDHAQPIRRAVNSLHETNERTDLGTLLINYAPKPGFRFINGYFEHLQMCWNTLVTYTDGLLHAYDEEKERFTEPLPAIPPTAPEPLQRAVTRMTKIVQGVGWLFTGNPRENIIEPQLGYALRDLVMALQKGQGCAHGLVGIYEIDKRT